MANTLHHLGPKRGTTLETQLNLPAVTVGGISIDRVAELQAALKENPDAVPGATISIFERQRLRHAALRENACFVVPRTLHGVDEANDGAVDPLGATVLSAVTRFQIEETGIIETLDLDGIDFTGDHLESDVAAPTNPEQAYAVAAPEFEQRASELFALATDSGRAATNGPIPIQWFSRMIEDDPILAKLRTLPPYDIANHVRVIFNYELLPALMKCIDRVTSQRPVHAPINAIEADAHERVSRVSGFLQNADSLLATNVVPDAKGVSLRTKVGDVVTVEVAPGLRVSIELYRNLRKQFTSERQPDRAIGALPATLFGTELMLTFSSPLFSVPGTARTQNEGYRAVVLANDVGDGVVRGEAFHAIRREQGGMRQADVHNDKTAREKYPHVQMLLLDPRFGKPSEEGVAPTSATNINLKHQYAIADDTTRADAMFMFVIVNALTAALQKA